MIYIGIDPGLSGGVAAVDEDGRVVAASKMPATDHDLLMLLGSVQEDGIGAARCMLERVHSLPKQGHVGAFTFGCGYGAIRMGLTAARIPFDLVTPQTWQQAMGCRTKGDKNISKRRAQALFPSVPITHAIADALLLAEYGRRLEVRPTASKEHHGEEEDRTQERQTAGGQTLQGGRRQGKTEDLAQRTARTGQQTRPAVGPTARHGAGSQRPA